MLEQLCIGFRVGLLVMTGLVHVRQHLPFSVDSRQYGAPIARGPYDTMRGSGDSWWHERRDDMAVLSMKIRACELNAANATRLGRRVGCFIQQSKLRARRRLTGMAKNAVQFAVEQFFAYREALTVGPNAMLVFFKLLLSMASTALGIGKLIYHRQYLFDMVRGYVEDWVYEYIPKSLELPEFAKQCTVYVSDEAHEEVSRIMGMVAASKVDAVPDYEDTDDEDDDVPQPRASPPSATRGGGGVEGEPMETPTEMSGRGCGHLPPPPQQQVRRVVSFDQSHSAKRMGAVDDATAHVMNLFRTGTGAEQDIYEDVTQTDSVDRLAVKKRVVFKDELVDADDAEIGGRTLAPTPPVRRAPAAAAPPSRPQDDLQTASPAPRARPGAAGALGKRMAFR